MELKSYTLHSGLSSQPNMPMMGVYSNEEYSTDSYGQSVHSLIQELTLRVMKLEQIVQEQFDKHRELESQFTILRNLYYKKFEE